MLDLAIGSMKAAPLAGQGVADGDPPPEVPQARLSAPTLVEALARPNAIDERVDQDDATHHSRKGCELPHGHILPGVYPPRERYRDSLRGQGTQSRYLGGRLAGLEGGLPGWAAT